jgi:hypothetical protein
VSSASSGNGGSGGGIHSDGALTLTGSIITSSTTGSAGSGTGHGHRGYGGGVYNGGEYTGSTATVRSSALTSNTAASGGGIWNALSDTLTVTGSTFSSNSTDTYGGGLYNEGTATVGNTTFSGNSTRFGGGIFNAPTTGISLTLRNITVANNTTTAGGGGLYQFSGSLDIANSLLTGNSAPFAPDYNYEGGTRTDSGNNFVDSSAGQTWIAAGDISGNTATVLAPLADNGGTTALPDGTHPKTYALLTSCTPATHCPIDNGNTTICAASPVSRVDERGLSRLLLGKCDIGAFEVQPPPPNPLPQPAPSGGGSGAPGALPSARPPGAVGGAPNPLPPPRP